MTNLVLLCSHVRENEASRDRKALEALDGFRQVIRKLLETPARLRAAGRHGKEADVQACAWLTKVGLVPDGKDFMIHTPRSNTLITRACWSDKVHHSATHSAFRVISWSTDSSWAVSRAHTHEMYLGRSALRSAYPAETALVELWGKRLEKCPAGYSMLSDRGLANTAQLYPNFNAHPELSQREISIHCRRSGV